MIISLIIINNSFHKRNICNISYEEKQKLMQLLKRTNSSTFSPIEIKNVDMGFGDTTLCYTLKFGISKDDYNENNLNYKNNDTTETILNWKSEKNEDTYICYVRTMEGNNIQKELIDKIVINYR